MDYNKYLKHVGQIKTTASNKYGDTSATTTTTMMCFVYQTTDERTVDANARRHEFQYHILLPRTLQPKVNDQVADVKDKDGSAVFTKGIITTIIAYRHPRKGIQLVEAVLKVD